MATVSTEVAKCPTEKGISPMRNPILIPLVLLSLVGCGFHPPARETANVEDAPSLLPHDHADEESSSPHSDADTEHEQAADSDGWRDLFDGTSLTNWKSSEFGGEGEVEVTDGFIHLDFGHPMTGITWTGSELPHNNYEILVEAKRIEGFDFFSTITFPVDEAHCSFVVGGWGGSVTGISSIDDMDASENETTDYLTFTNGQWYTIRVQIKPGEIQAWIDDKKVVNVEVAGKKLSTRIEVDFSKPFGISCFDCQAALRKIRVRELPPADGH